MDNLPQLRDIHLPEEAISAFPLACGWWIVVAGIILCLILFRIFILLHRKSKKVYAKYLLNKYAKENTLDAAISMSEILRRICIKKYPYAVSLNGKEWSDFLCSKSKHPLGKSAALLLQTAPYRKEDDSISVQDIEELRRFCFNWVGENL